MTRTLYGDRWKIERSLSEGGQAHVFIVKDASTSDDSEYVLKRLKNYKRMDRFEREIEAAKQLNHPYIARFIDYSLDEPAFFVSEFVSERTLEDIERLDPLEALVLFEKLCVAIEHAHDKGIIHRDLKPENIMLRENDDPVIVDFGLCYYQDQEDRYTASMEQVGSKFYIAPEMESGRSDRVTAAIDIYSLGKILYFMLSGRHLARELFYDEGDLSRICSNKQLTYITKNILSVTVTEDPTERINIDELSVAAREVQHLIQEHYYPGIIGTKCRFCGQGTYSRMEGTMRFDMMLDRGVMKPSIVHMVVCNKCKNVQWFTWLQNET